MLREGEIVRDNMGHANVDVTQNVYRQELVGRVDAVTHNSGLLLGQPKGAPIRCLTDSG
jgi:hypothetical protein